MTGASSMREAGHSKLVLRDNPEGSGGKGVGRGVQDECIHVHPWLSHVNVQQNPLQQCQVISFQLKLITKKVTCSVIIILAPSSAAADAQ